MQDAYGRTCARGAIKGLVAAHLAAVLTYGSAHAQQTHTTSDGRTAPRVAYAIRATPTAPNVDGRLDDDAWREATPITEFTQAQPVDGTEPPQRTEVRVVYDDDGLYVAARMYDRAPNAISSRLGRRDTDTSSDLFTVMIDSYHDHRTTFEFQANPAGIRADYVAANDSRNVDMSWNPVWELATSIDSRGWIAEMRILFSQLRFPHAVEQQWGINFSRYVFRNDELVRWNWAPNTETGYASLFGHLHGLRDVPAPRRIEVLPYTVAKSDFTEGADPANPFNDGSVQNVSAGLDLKYGLTSELTLDATFNPDFGQVEADPAVVNLTAFETYFSERRPFFVEAADVFSFGGAYGYGVPQLFYSRRIGKGPSRSVFEEGGFVDNPGATRILGAAKFSGKTGGWSVGLLDAVTARASARIQRAGGTRVSEPVEPLTNHGVLSLRKDMRGGGSGIGMMATSVQRDIDDPSFESLRSSAHTGGVDFFHRFGNNRFVTAGTFTVSHIRGSSSAITLAQRSPARYFQRPDQGYVSVDSNATSLSGWGASLFVGKISGNWTYDTGFRAWSPGLELNDAGYQQYSDRIGHHLHISRRWLDAGRVFRRFTIMGEWFQTWNFGGIRTLNRPMLSVNGQFLNYWGFLIGGIHDLRVLSDRATWGGPLMQRPAAWRIYGSVESDSRKPVVIRPNGGVSLDIRPTAALNLAIMPRFTKSRAVAFYVMQFGDPTAKSTFGSRYVFGELEQKNVDITMRMDLALTPDLSIQFYAQPFLAAGAYEEFRELAAPRTFDFLRYGVDGGSTISLDDRANTYTVDPDGTGPAEVFSFGNPDFRYRSLRSNLVVRWEYLPASTLFFVWNHGQSGRETDPTFNLFDEFGSMFGDDQRNTFMVKVNYWLSR